MSSAAERFDSVDICALLLGDREQALVHLGCCESGWSDLTSRTPECEWAGLCGRGAAMAVGGGEVLDGLAADEEVLELAVDDDVDGLGGDAFVVDLVGADEAAGR